MTDGTLTLYGVTVVWDGVPLGGEVRAYDEAIRAKGAELELIESLALTVLNLRRPASMEAFTREKLHALPFNGDTIHSLQVVTNAIQAVMKGEILGAVKPSGKPKPTRPRATGGASGQPSPGTTAPR